MIDLFAELAAIEEVLQSHGIPYAIVGGLAYSIWVEVRATEDIDLLIRPEDWERMPALLEPLGFLWLAGSMDFPSIRIRRLTKLIEREALVLDFLLADGAFEEGLRRRAKLIYKGRPVYVARPDVIIDLKKLRMSRKDIVDIEGLRIVADGQSPESDQR